MAKFLLPIGPPLPAGLSSGLRDGAPLGAFELLAAVPRGIGEVSTYPEAPWLFGGISTDSDYVAVEAWATKTLGVTWSKSLALTAYDHAFEEASFNVSFSGGQSTTHRGTWRLLDDDTLELQGNEREDDLDYGSASRTTTGACNVRSELKIVLGEDGEVARLVRGDEVFARSRSR